MRRWPFAVAAFSLLMAGLSHQKTHDVTWHDPSSAVFLVGYILAAALALAIKDNSKGG